MNKNAHNSDELDLIEFSTLIWNNKLKIFLITILISLIGISYKFFINEKKNHLPSEDLFEFSLKINHSNNPQFFQFISTISAMYDTPYLNPTIIVKPTNQLDKEIVFDRFIKELMDYEEIVTVLSNNPNFLKNVANLDERDKQVELYKFAKSLTVRKNSNEDAESLTYYIKFKWILINYLI